MTNENENISNDLDNDQVQMEIGIEWIAAHLLSIIMFLEDKFGATAGYDIGNVASNLMAQFNGEEQDSE